MQAGKLDTRVTIQQRTTTQDSMGSPTETWTTFKSVWAEVTRASGREVVAGGAPGAMATTQPVRVRIRYLAGVTAAMRVVVGARTLQIVSPGVPGGGRRDFLDLICEEIDA